MPNNLHLDAEQLRDLEQDLTTMLNSNGSARLPAVSQTNAGMLVLDVLVSHTADKILIGFTRDGDKLIGDQYLRLARVDFSDSNCIEFSLHQQKVGRLGVTLRTKGGTLDFPYQGGFNRRGSSQRGEPKFGPVHAVAVQIGPNLYRIQLPNKLPTSGMRSDQPEPPQQPRPTTSTGLLLMSVGDREYERPITREQHEVLEPIIEAVLNTWRIRNG